jgi:diguanylate cyclase (GGDEF)-like protein
LGIVAAATVVLVVVAALLLAALSGRGPLSGRLPEMNRSRAQERSEEESEDPGEDAAPITSLSAAPTIRLLARDRRLPARADAPTRRGLRSSDEVLDDVLQGGFAIDTYNRAVRVLAWSFILIALLIVSVSQLWQPVQSQIIATLILAGIFVLIVHEVVPPTHLRAPRVIMEGSAALVFLTLLIVQTGHSSSPFFLLYPLLIGGTALIAPPRITLVLTLETAVAYAIAAFSGPMDQATSRDALARVAINLTALVLLAYSGMAVARVQRRMREAAVRLSTVDSLTDLHNRAYFFNAMEREIQRGRRFGRGFCLLMMDLDGLKSINDRYGHYQGDVVLRGVAQLIRAGLRGVDVAARYGGDEFVALLPETDPSGAYVVAEKIRQTVSELLVESGGHQITTSMSIGVVVYPDDGKTADELMIAADEAMYSSKRLGKNRVVGYAEPDQANLAPPLPPRPQVSTPGFRPLPRE